MNPFEVNVILLDHFIGNGTTSLIHKSLFEKYGYFDDKIGFMEDFELWLRLCLQFNCRIHLVSKILAKYRVHEQQLPPCRKNWSRDSQRWIFVGEHAEYLYRISDTASLLPRLSGYHICRISD